MKSLRNQCTGKKEFGVYLRNLQRDNISEYRAKIRGCRIIEPNADDGTIGLRSVAERARAIAQMHEDYVIEVQMCETRA